MLVDVFWGSVLHNLALVHHENAVAYSDGFVLVVCDHDEGRIRLALHVAKFRLQFFAEVCIEGAERFIEQKNVRLVHEGAGEGNTLLLTAAQGCWHFLGEVRDVHDFHHLLHALVDFVFRNLLALEAEGDVVVDVQVREQRVTLENGVDVSLCRGFFGNVFATENHSPFIGLFKACDNAEERRLAAARRAEQRYELAILDGDVDILQDSLVAKALLDTLDVQVDFVHGQQ